MVEREGGEDRWVGRKEGISGGLVKLSVSIQALCDLISRTRWSRAEL